MAFSLRQEQALDGDSTKRGQIDEVCVLDAVSETPARGNERILEQQGADRDREIHKCKLQIADCTSQPRIVPFDSYVRPISNLQLTISNSFNLILSHPP